MVPAAAVTAVVALVRGGEGRREAVASLLLNLLTAAAVVLVTFA